MDRDLAGIIISACYRSTRELGDLAPLIKEHCEESDYLALRTAIGSAIYDILENIATHAASKYPDLKAEIESRIEKYGRAF